MIGQKLTPEQQEAQRIKAYGPGAKFVNNNDGTYTFYYAHGAKATINASNKTAVLSLASKVEPNQIEQSILDDVKSIKLNDVKPNYQEQLAPAIDEYKNVDVKESLDPAVVAQTNYDKNYTNLRTQLETQYNNLVSADSRFGYAGRNTDLNAIFNQQAAQLASAGVESIGDLRIGSEPIYAGAFGVAGPNKTVIGQKQVLINSKTGEVVTNSNLGGQVAVDRDTGVQKWGDIFSGVQGGANYGIMQAPDGSVVLFPAWEKTKSLAAQIGGETLEKYITPILTIGGAVVGVPGLGNVAGAAAGAAAGSSVGQVLSTGKVDWEKVATSAAIAGAGAYVSGLLAPEAAAVGEATKTAGEAAGAAGSAADAAFIAEDAANLFAQTGDINAVQQALIGAGVDPVIAAEAANLSSFGLNSAQIASQLPTTMVGEIFGPSANTLRIQDLAFVGDDAAQLYKQTGNVAAVQQNLIAAGVDPIIAAEASNLAAFGQSGPAITANLNQAFPSDVVFTSEGLLSGGSTLDDFAKDISGISSTAGAALNIKDVLGMARTGAKLFGGQQQQVGLLGGGQVAGGARQAGGVDYSGLLTLLQGKAGVPGVSPLLSPVVSPLAQQQNLLNAPMPQYQPLSLNLLG